MRAAYQGVVDRAAEVVVGGKRVPLTDELYEAAARWCDGEDVEMPAEGTRRWGT